jgi:bla regulator protein blaR1
MIAFLIKSALAMALFLAFYHLVLSREVLFKFNRFYLIFSLLFALAIPFLTFPNFILQNWLNPIGIWDEIHPFNPALPLEYEGIFQSIYAEKFLEEQPLLVEDHEISNQVVPSWFWWTTVYFLGFLFFTLGFIFKLTGFRKLIRANEVIKKEGVIYVLLNEHIVPFTFLHYLFVSKKDFESKAIESEILVHEMAHIRQKHSWDILVVQLIHCLLWFNPLLLWFKKAIRLNHEFLADETVNKTFGNIPSYQWLIFSKVSSSKADLGLSSTFAFSVTRNRLRMMGRNTTVSKAYLIKGMTIFVLTLAFFFLSPSTGMLAFPQLAEVGEVNEYEEIISMAFEEENQYMLDLGKLDILALHHAYQQLSDFDKGSVTEFPFFEKPAFERLLELQKISDKVQVKMRYNSPPPTKKIKPDVWENWKKAKKLEVEIDEKSYDRTILDQNSPEDFVLFEVRETEPKKFLKNAGYIVKLTTPEGYHQKFVLPKKELQNILAIFENGDRAEVNFFLKHIFANNVANLDDFVPFIPKNFEASFLDAFLHFNPQNYREMKFITTLDMEKEIPITLYIDDERKDVYIPIIEDLE